MADLSASACVRPGQLSHSRRLITKSDLSKKLPSTGCLLDCKKLIQTNGSDCKFSSNFFSLAKIAWHIGRVTACRKEDKKDGGEDEDEDKKKDEDKKDGDEDEEMLR